MCNGVNSKATEGKIQSNIFHYVWEKDLLFSESVLIGNKIYSLPSLLLSEFVRFGMTNQTHSKTFPLVLISEASSLLRM